MFANAMENAGVGSGRPQGNELDSLPTEPRQSPQGMDENAPGPLPRYLSFDAPEDYLAEGEAPDNSQSDMVMQLVEQNRQLMELLKNQPQAQMQQAPQAQQQQAPIDYFQGYETEAFLNSFTTDPNAAIVQAPAFRQILDHIQRQDQEIKNMRGYIEQQNYYEDTGINDPEDRKIYKELYGKASQDPKQVLELAAKQIRAERLAKAKEAQGLTGKSPVGERPGARPQPAKVTPMPFDNRMNSMIQRALSRQSK
jgi:hypothetical protein